MSGRDVVEEIRARADIVEIISDYVNLKRAGNAYKGLCPFHSERTPSFSVNPARQIFHCFGCGAGGDVFSFLQRHEGLSFPETLRILGERYGVTVPRYSAEGSELRERSLDLLGEAQAWFRKRFRGSPAEEYVSKRGVDDATAATFGLGFAPDGWQNLTGHLEGKGFRPEELNSSGVVSVGKGGRLFDTFRGRLVFPIADTHGRVVGFGGRVLGNGEPKYLNSPETSLFQKGRLLYGLHLARDTVRREGCLLIVEGYMDVIACHRHGIRNAVAPLGTALTEQHAALVKRFADRICLVFDSDPAGIRAATRSLPLLLARDLDLRVLVLPEGDDPDSCLNREGPDAFRGRVERGSAPMVEFLINHALEGSAGHRARRALDVVRLIPSPLERSQAIRKLSELLDVREAALIEELGRLGTAPGTAGARADAPGPPAPGAEDAVPPPPRDELFLLALALRDETYASRLCAELGEHEFSSAPLRMLFGKLKRLREGGLPLEYSSFSKDGLSEGESRGLTAAYSLDILDEAQEEGFGDCLARMRQRQDQSRTRLLRERIKNGDREAMRELIEVERRWKAAGEKERP